MSVNILVSGFPNGFTAEFTRQVKAYLPVRAGLAFVASDFDAHERTVQYLAHFVEQFARAGIAFPDAVAVDFRLTAAEAQRAVREAGVVWLAGGNTLQQMEHIRRHGLIPALRERDGLTIGMSAGAINMARRVVLARDPDDDIPELAVYDGIGLMELNVEPHLNEASAAHLDDIGEAAWLAPIYGLPDESFIVCTEDKNEFFGPYTRFYNP